MLMDLQNHSLACIHASPYASDRDLAPVAGLLTGLSLIVAIGAQNAFVLRQGLARAHVGVVVADLRALRRRPDRGRRHRHRHDRRARAVGAGRGPLARRRLPDVVRRQLAAAGPARRVAARGHRPATAAGAARC